MMAVECTPDKKQIREALDLDRGRVLCIVNSFTSEEMKKYDAARGNDYGSRLRYGTVMNHFDRLIVGDRLEDAQKILKGEYGFMCQYDDEPDFETVWSSVFDLKSRIIYRAEGDPRRKKFIKDSRLYDCMKK